VVLSGEMDAQGDDSGKEGDSYGRFPSRSDRDLALTRLLRAEDAVTTATLRGLGFSERELRGLISHGDLHRLHRGVYGDGRARLSPWGHLRAALLAPAAHLHPCLSHRSAAAARKDRAVNTREVHVSVIADHTPRIPGLILHRTTEPGRGEVRLLSGLRVASLPRILLELAPTATDRELQDLITQGERRNALDPIAEVLPRHARRPGISHLKQLLDHHITTPAGNSNLEEPFWAWYATEPDLPPPDAINIHLGPYEFDSIWRKERLVLEIDSRTYHQAKADMEKDRLKDIYVQKLGLRIVRITAHRFEHDRAGIRADLLAFLPVRL
jgi:hypothetical protein